MIDSCVHFVCFRAHAVPVDRFLEGRGAMSLSVAVFSMCEQHAVLRFHQSEEARCMQSSPVSSFTLLLSPLSLLYLRVQGEGVH